MLEYNININYYAFNLIHIIVKIYLFLEILSSSLLGILKFIIHLYVSSLSHKVGIISLEMVECLQSISSSLLWWSSLSQKEYGQCRSHFFIDSRMPPIHLVLVIVMVFIVPKRGMGWRMGYLWYDRSHPIPWATLNEMT